MKPGGQRDKGKRAERALAHALTDAGFPARRGVQYQGGPGSPDVACESLPGIHWESKHCAQFRPYEWIEQARSEAAEGKLSVVAFRRNHSELLAVLRLDDFLRIVRESSFVDESEERPRVMERRGLVGTVGEAVEAIEGEIVKVSR